MDFFYNKLWEYRYDYRTLETVVIPHASLSARQRTCLWNALTRAVFGVDCVPQTEPYLFDSPDDGSVGFVNARDRYMALLYHHDLIILKGLRVSAVVPGPKATRDFALWFHFEGGRVVTAHAFEGSDKNNVPNLSNFFAAKPKIVIQLNFGQKLLSRPAFFEFSLTETPYTSQNWKEIAYREEPDIIFENNYRDTGFGNHPTFGLVYGTSKVSEDIDGEGLHIVIYLSKGEEISRNRLMRIEDAWVSHYDMDQLLTERKMTSFSYESDPNEHLVIDLNVLTNNVSGSVVGIAGSSFEPGTTESEDDNVIAPLQVSAVIAGERSFSPKGVPSDWKNPQVQIPGRFLIQGLINVQEYFRAQINCYTHDRRPEYLLLRLPVWKGREVLMNTENLFYAIQESIHDSTTLRLIHLNHQLASSATSWPRAVLESEISRLSVSDDMWAPTP